jgi:hypothetical protein
MRQAPRAIGLLFFVLVLGGAGVCNREQALTAALPPGSIAEDRIKGVTLDSPRPPDTQTLLRLHEIGVTHLTIIPQGFQERHNTPSIRFNPDARWFSESDAGIRAVARQADSLGIQLIIKPHIWADDFSASGMLPQHVGFETEAEWRQWESEYRTFLLHYARLAEDVGAPLLCIGTELARAARERPAFWRELIRGIRSVYSGELTYAANWYGEYEHIEFWNALDYIGVQAYFPVSTRSNPSLEVLQEGWTAHRNDLLALSAEIGKPVLFTEIGYRSIASAAAEPWLWPERDEIGSVQPDFDLQARLYQAFFEEVWSAPFFAGAIIWKWHPESVPGSGRRPANRTLDFTPQGKPAEEVIARWFNGQQP